MAEARAWESSGGITKPPPLFSIALAAVPLVGTEGAIRLARKPVLNTGV
ncbi:hypothetical protein WH8501_05290 [Crocosphaera watsonii WH 8501]